jgi:hypothetical protein
MQSSQYGAYRFDFFADVRAGWSATADSTAAEGDQITSRPSSPPVKTTSGCSEGQSCVNVGN